MHAILNFVAIRPDNINHRILSFKYALEGIYSTFRLEPNFKFHVLGACIVVVLGAIFQVSQPEWLVLIIVITLVITLELTNTAIESLVDLLSPEYHINAKLAKDISAGAVFTASVGAIVCGLIIFLPHLLRLK